MADKIKLGLAALALVAGIGGYYYLGDKALLIRVLVLLAALVVTVVIALTTAVGRAAQEFTRDSLVELRKVVWPTRKDTVQITLVVVAMVVFVALFLWIIDWGLLAAVKALTGQGA
ncbi:MAG TPA: preprotein translocase subunit SecE [Gammaproteobacteria bacterium]|nr:preprotein translocase subunit SecE [Gammaproteobacteria bacterium]